MANKYYALNYTDVASWLTSFKEALIDKFGDGVTINNSTTSELTFTCPSISENAINVNGNYMRRGTVSGATFSNIEIFMYAYSGIRAHVHLVLGDSFLFLVNNASYRETIVVAKTIGGVSIFFGAISNSSSCSNCKFLGYKDGVKVLTQPDFVDTGRIIYSDVGVPYKMPLMIFDKSVTGDQMLRKSDGTIDTIDNLWMSAFSPGTTGASYLRFGGLFSPTDLYTAGAVLKLRSAILAEYE